MDSLLPLEIWQYIFGYLSRQDLIAFSMVCVRLRSLASSTVFKTLKASNSTTNFQGLTDVLNKHGHKVTKFRLECHLTPNGLESEEIPACDVPQEILDLLNGSRLPNSQTTEIEFKPYEDFNGPIEDDWENDHEDSIGKGSIYIHDRSEEAHEIAEVEFEYQWRRNINDVFNALTQNHRTTILLIRRLIPRLCSVFFEPKWKAFLGRLLNLELELWGGDNGVGWHSNTLPAYGHFVQDLQSHLFNGLENVTRLKFVSDNGSPIGCEGYNHSPVPLIPENLPQLRILELENFFIDPALLTFLSREASLLKCLRFKNCFAAAEGVFADNPISWAKFLNQLCSIQPSHLSEIIIVNDRVPLSEYEDFPDENYDRSAEPEDIKEIWAKLEKDNTRMLFSYKHLDSKYGMVFNETEQNVESFNKGEDQDAYNRLMELLAANRGSENNV